MAQEPKRTTKAIFPPPAGPIEVESPPNVEKIYRTVLQSKIATIPTFHLDVIAMAQKVSFDAPVLAEYMVCLWKVISDVRQTPRLDFYDIAISAADIFLNSGRKGDWLEYSTSALIYARESKLLTFGSHFQVRGPTPKGREIIDKFGLRPARKERKLLSESQAWPWSTNENDHRLLTEVAAHLSKQLELTMSSITHWSSSEKWTEGVPQADNRGSTVSRKKVLQTLNRKNRLKK